MTGLTLRLFGSPEVRHDGEEVEGFRSAKARALLFYVVVSEIPQARTKLAGLLWGELPEENANANLRKTLTNLRKVADPYLTITRDTVAVDENNPPWLDVHEFKMALDSRDFERLEAAVDLYRGEFLDGFYLHEAREFESWQLDERYRLRERMLAALNRLAEGYAERGQFSKAIRSAQRLLTMEPLREDAHRLLMALYARNGQPARALRQFETCVQLLETELGVAPDLQTRRLVEAIRAGEFVPESPLWTGDQEPHVASHIGQGPDAFDDQRPGNEGAQGLFIGREQELAHLDEALSEVLAARGRLVFVTGEAGRGKSALLAEFARRAPNREPHLIVALGTCNAFSGAGDPFHPFREILTSLGKQVDRISQKRSERVQLQSQFADILTAVARQHPLLLLLDDLQWADNSSLNLLFHLSRRLSSLPILVLGAYRASDAALARATAPLPSLFAELKRRLEVSEIDLERLSPHVRREFVDALIDSEPNHLAESFRVTFYRHTQGHA
ncbi:MAG TPA: AAA family ATPase, partial [Candidatus Binatia bacterium]|nr:AAA family ATPase [Candidatus Binatia bacterium]